MASGERGAGPPAVLFDLYDTLAWVNWPSVREGRARLAERARVEARCFLEQCDRTVAPRSLGRLGGPEEELGRLLGPCGAAAERTLLAELARLDRETWRRSVHLFDDARDALGRLRRRGCRLGIVSNCSWQGGEVVHAQGLDRHVDAVVLSFEVGMTKPEPAMLALAFERLGAAAAQVVLVDDLVENLDAARGLGARTLLVDRRGRGSDGDHRRITGLLDLEEALFS